MATHSRLPKVQIELEAALLRELRATFHELNARHFKRSLRPVRFELSDVLGRLGQWDPRLRVSLISRALAFDRRWGVVVEVLKHEMAHQFVQESLQRCDEPAHGPAFQETCARLGIDPRASGVPDDPAEQGATEAGDGSGSARDIRILDRIRRLLALAESPNLHEAQAAASAAQRLMLKYNLECSQSMLPTGYGFRHLGRATGRVSESERLLSLILSDHFFVEVIWVPVYRALEGRRGHVLEICGTPANLEMAMYVHSFLTESAERLWREHKKSEGIASNRERRTYLAGVMEGFRDKLETQRTSNREQGLVWVGDVELSKYYRRRHPYIQHTRSQGNRHTSARSQGRAAGRSLVLHQAIRGESRSHGRLLGPATKRSG
jgi:hypothetical protein